MKRSIVTFLSATALISGLCAGQFAPTAQAATHFQLLKKQIDVNGTTLSRPYGLVYQNTSYMPIWYVMQLLNSFNVTNQWNGHEWDLTLPSSVSVSPHLLTSGTSGATVKLNGVVVERVQSVVTTDPASGKATTFMPIWYIMQLLDAFNVTSTWDGTDWAVDTSQARLTADPNQSSQSASTPGPAPAPAPTVDNASVFFDRASDSLYISAQTGNPVTTQQSNASMDDIRPGQPIYLFTWQQNNGLDPAHINWLVNNSNATVEADTNHRFTIDTGDGNPQPVGAATFVASQPGVYTIQSETATGTYSVPMVVVVGESSLPVASPSLPVGSSGIRPLSAMSGAKPKATVTNSQGTTFSVYPPTSDGWIPISGHSSAGLHEVEVTFGANPDMPVWSYAIPVNSQGNFAADVRSPESGKNVQLTLFTQYTKDMTNWGNGQDAVDNPQTVNVFIPATATPPSQAEMDLFASAKMNFNVDPVLGQVAKTLDLAAGSTDAAIEAINNYVADAVVYDQSELQPTGYRFQNALQTWQTKLGICEDYAEVEASMLKAIGIRAETIQGRVTDSGTGTTDPANQNGDNHEWVKAWDGSKWVLADPTWSTADETTTDWLTNQFFTNTQNFQSTHQADSQATGTPA
ncbi:transglutaminase-like domain-containing protein [Alicyclobacillus dauci]|uniref:Transglutaminase-like domain-containing protein n=1 Tax=Alicyclobacillus dauci TaxID=1475485 RepID=A0ABY6Z4W7_9BACL|nr:transglutaminase-like domain-containing protein [Alicyclobacillus dauci]WAH37810.1 transglutaminase-like domain-containing protein [Alicyclobacillus dauci]